VKVHSGSYLKGGEGADGEAALFVRDAAGRNDDVLRRAPGDVAGRPLRGREGAEGCEPHERAVEIVDAKLALRVAVVAADVARHEDAALIVDCRRLGCTLSCLGAWRGHSPVRYFGLHIDAGDEEAVSCHLPQPLVPSVGLAGEDQGVARECAVASSLRGVMCGEVVGFVIKCEGFAGLVRAEDPDHRVVVGLGHHGWCETAHGEIPGRMGGEGGGGLVFAAGAEVLGAEAPARDLGDPPAQAVLALAIDEDVEGAEVVDLQVDGGAVDAGQDVDDIVGAPGAALVAATQVTAGFALW